MTAAGSDPGPGQLHTRQRYIPSVRVRFAATRPTTSAARLVLSHFLDRPSVAASLRWYRDTSPRTAAVTTEAWAYEPGTDRTPDGTRLAPAVAAWIRAAVTSGPTR
jgi:hypothetical protein